MNTERFRNGLAETRNRTVRTSRKPSTCSKWSKTMIKYVFWAWSMNLSIIVCNQTDCFLLLLPYYGKFFDLCLYYYLLCWRGNKHFDVHFWRIKLVFFLSKDGKDATYERRNGWKSVFFPPETASFVFEVNMIEIFFPYLYLDLECEQLCFPPRKRCK